MGMGKGRGRVGVEKRIEGMNEREGSGFFSLQIIYLATPMVQHTKSIHHTVTKTHSQLVTEKSVCCGES